MPCILICVSRGYQEGVVDDGQDVDLGDDVVHLLELDDLALLQYFEREELLRLFIQGESHPAERA